MRILFVKPRLTSTTLGGADYSLCEPLEFETLAAGVPDHDVAILDLRFDPDLEAAVAGFRPDIVGTTCMSVNIYAARNILERVKAIDRTITTVVGGYHATVAAEDLAEPYVDAIAIGQAVDTFRELVRALEASRPLGSVPGLGLPVTSGLVEYTSGRAKVFALDSQPIPNRGFNPHHRKSYFCEYWQPAAIMRASIGCHARCNFCALWNLTDGKYLTHSVNHVADEIQTIPERYVFFVDDNFIPKGHETRVDGIRQEIQRRNIKKEYYFSTRTDMVAARPDLIERWRKVGLKRIFFGLESYDNKKLRELNKGTTSDMNRRAIDVCHANDIAVTGCFIVTPDFTRDDFARLLDYTAKLDLNIVAYLVLTPHPGTVLYNMRRNEIARTDYELWDHMHSVFETTLPEKEFYRDYARLWLLAYTPLTWDGTKRIMRIFCSASLAQKRILGRVAMTVFPKIALAAAGQRNAGFADWLRWACGQTERSSTGKVDQVRPLLPSLAVNSERALRRTAAVSGEVQSVLLHQ